MFLTNIIARLSYLVLLVTRLLKNFHLKQLVELTNHKI
jgi:hypothetical protein